MTAKPNKILTPGVYGNVVVARNVTTAVKTRVFWRYGIGRLRRILYTIDHLVPLELCGTNDLLNLWPQPRLQARVKDRDENRLSRAWQSGQMSLDMAQQEILRLWGGQA